MAAEYRLVSYADGGAAKAGVLIGDRVVPAATLLAGADGIDDSCRMNLALMRAAIFLVFGQLCGTEPT
jgi:hypothetical protein